MKPIFKRLLAIGRGALKGAFPGVSGAIEAIRNVKGVEVSVTTPAGETVKGIAQPYSWWSIVPSLISAGVMIYLWQKGALTEKQIGNMIDALIEVLTK